MSDDGSTHIQPHHHHHQEILLQAPQGGDLEEGDQEQGGGAQAQEEPHGGDQVLVRPPRPRVDDQLEQQQQPPQPPEARWYKQKIRKAKNLLLFPFRKVHKFYTGRCRIAYYYYGDDPGGCCCRCFTPPPPISPPRLRNPGNPGCRSPTPSSYEFVKFLIESNDFYAPQCNAHGGSYSELPT